MKRFIKFLAISILIVSLSFGIYKVNNRYGIDIISKNIDWTINHKGIKGAKSFDFDNDGNLYIAFSDCIKIVKENNKEETLVKRSYFNIYDMIIYNGEIILATGNDIIKYNYENDEKVDIITDLPNKGIDKDTKLMVKDDILYVTISSNTNSGIVEKENANCDIASFEWILTGKNYGENNTGAFSSYGVSTKSGEKIKEGTISNASIITYDLKSNKVATYATGIRNVEGIDYTSEDKIIAIVGGMEDYGARPIKDDKDYIYEIKENAWYGWPDYSGGDSVTSARFSDGYNKIETLISNPPTKTPYGPMYQHINLSSLKGLAIDRNGNVLKENSIIFADNTENYLYILSNDNVANKIVDLGDNSKVEVIRCYEDGIYVLDSKQGCLYKLQSKLNNSMFNLPSIIWIFIVIFFITIITSIIIKFNDKKKSRRTS